jgi:hypothetical protein
MLFFPTQSPNRAPFRKHAVSLSRFHKDGFGWMGIYWVKPL